MGHFITEADIRAAFGSDIGFLLQSRIPGVHVGGTPANAQYLFSQRGPNGFTGSGRCKVAVYLDGMRLTSGNIAEWPLSLGGIEYYSPSTAPVRYREPSPVGRNGEAIGGSAACGVLLLWTRP